MAGACKSCSEYPVSNAPIMVMSAALASVRRRTGCELVKAQERASKPRRPAAVSTGEVFDRFRGSWRCEISEGSEKKP
jgi:hypothetical protein